MRVNKSERLVILAIKAGYVIPFDIVEQTGLCLKVVNFAITLLEMEHGVEGITALRDILVPPQPEAVSFTSHDCVIVDKQLAPGRAASLLMQVLGDKYCIQLLGSLKSQL